MALGYDVILFSATRCFDGRRAMCAWRCDPPWFDGWELSRDRRMKGDGYPLVAVLSADEVRSLHARYSKRERCDDTIVPMRRPARSESEDSALRPEDHAPSLDALFDHDDLGIPIRPGIPPLATVAELDSLLADAKLEWVVIELWDRS